MVPSVLAANLRFLPTRTNATVTLCPVSLKPTSTNPLSRLQLAVTVSFRSPDLLPADHARNAYTCTRLNRKRFEAYLSAELNVSFA